MEVICFVVVAQQLFVQLEALDDVAQAELVAGLVLRLLFFLGQALLGQDARTRCRSSRAASCVASRHLTTSASSFATWALSE